MRRWDLIGDNYWQTVEGRIDKARGRAMMALHLDLPLEPKSKKSARPAHREAVQAHVREGAGPWMKATGGKNAHWPRPRADLALDVHIFSGERNSPRIDTACKGLLDELGGPDVGEVIYEDDRQVKWLFASKSVRTDLDAETATAAGVAFFGVDQAPAPSTRFDPHIYVTAQTRANRVANLKLAIDLDPSWKASESNTNPFLKREIEIDFDEDYLAGLDPSGSDFDRAERARTLHQLQYQQQASPLQGLDRLVPNLLRNFASDPLSVYGWVLPSIKQSPYAFELGTIPEASGDTDIFKLNVREQMKQRTQRYPGLFPLVVSIGVTMLYFETGQGKDMDNLVRIVLPVLLDELQPPSEEQPYPWPDAEIDKTDNSHRHRASSDVQFIEAIALNKLPPDVQPGTAYLLLSSGWRHSSWWEDASRYIDGFPWTRIDPGRSSSVHDVPLQEESRSSALFLLEAQSAIGRRRPVAVRAATEIVMVRRTSLTLGTIAVGGSPLRLFLLGACADDFRSFDG
jgi:hypothetical protein